MEKPKKVMVRQMKAVKETQIKVIKGIIWGITLSVVVSFFLAEHFLHSVLGLLLGGTVSTILFLQLSQTLTQAVKMPPSKAQKFAMVRYFFRFSVTALVLFISIVLPFVSFLSTAWGMIIIKPVIYATHLFNDRTFFKNIFRRKEENSNGD